MKEGTETLMWCRYYPEGGKHVYDSSTLAYTRKRSKELMRAQLTTMTKDGLNKLMNDCTFEKVTVTIKQS